MPSESPLKTLLDSLRNMMTCVSIIMLATAACRYHQHLGLSSWLTFALAGVLIVLTGGVLIANAVSAGQELRKEGHWLALAVLAGIFLAVVVLLIHAVPAVSMGAAGQK